MSNFNPDEYTPNIGLDIFWKILNNALNTTQIRLNISQYFRNISKYLQLLKPSYSLIHFRQNSYQYVNIR